MAGGTDRLGSSSPLDHSAIEALSRAGASGDAAPVTEGEAAPADAQWDAARLVNSKLVGNMAMMARIMEAEDKALGGARSFVAGGAQAANAPATLSAKAKAAPTATSLDGVADITKTDWSTWKPTAADKKLFEAWGKLSPDEAKQAMSRLGYRQQHLIFDVVNHQSKDGKVAAVVGQAITQARWDAAGGTEPRHEARWIAGFSDVDLKAWYQAEISSQSSEVRDAVTQRLARVMKDAAGTNPALVKLQKQLDTFNLQGEAGKSQYRALKGMTEKALTDHFRALSKDPKTLAWTMQAVAEHSTDPKMEAALKKALVLEAKSRGSAVLFDFADAANHLMGKSGTQVRAAVIEVIHDQFKAVKESGPIKEKLLGPEVVRNRAADTLKKLVMADPMELMDELKHRNPALVDDLMNDIAMGYPDDPTKAADSLADVVGAVSQAVGVEAHGKIDTVAKDQTFRAHAETAGYVLGAAHNALDKLAEHQNKKIEHGGLILRVFKKGVTMVAGGFMAEADKSSLENVGKKGDGVIDWLEKREKNQVKDWQKKLGNDLGEVLNQAVDARVPKTAGDAERRQIRHATDSIAPYLTDGYKRARERNG